MKNLFLCTSLNHFCIAYILVPFGKWFGIVYWFQRFQLFNGVATCYLIQTTRELVRVMPHLFVHLSAINNLAWVSLWMIGYIIQLGVTSFHFWKGGTKFSGQEHYPLFVLSENERKKVMDFLDYPLFVWIERMRRQKIKEKYVGDIHNFFFLTRGRK